jgi:hypothetical protein
LVFSASQRQNWLAERLSRASPKISTLDVIESSWQLERQTEKDRHHRRELSYEL